VRLDFRNGFGRLAGSDQLCLDFFLRFALHQSFGLSEEVAQQQLQ
jgi:hypothetical protein